MENGTNFSDMISGWVGPDGADQDFVYADGWHEIKATGTSSPSVSISSIEQLDSAEPGELVVYRIDKCAPAQNGSITLYRKIHNLLEKLAPSPSSIDEFVLKLASAGYIDMKEYDSISFAVSSVQYYEINDSFPRLRRADLPLEITSAEYQIDLPSIAPWVK